MFRVWAEPGALLRPAGADKGPYRAGDHTRPRHQTVDIKKTEIAAAASAIPLNLSAALRKDPSSPGAPRGIVRISCAGAFVLAREMLPLCLI